MKSMNYNQVPEAAGSYATKKSDLNYILLPASWEVYIPKLSQQLFVAETDLQIFWKNQRVEFKPSMLQHLLPIGECKVEKLSIIILSGSHTSYHTPCK